MSRHDTFPVGRGCAVNSGEAIGVGVGVAVSSDGIGEQMLPGYFVPIESQDEIPDA